MNAGGAPEFLEIMPTGVLLAGNSPNPFRAGVAATVIRFAVPEKQKVTLRVFDVVGRVVQTLVDGNVDPGWPTPGTSRPPASGGRAR